MVLDTLFVVTSPKSRGVQAHHLRAINGARGGSAGQGEPYFEDQLRLPETDDTQIIDTAAVQDVAAVAAAQPP